MESPSSSRRALVRYLAASPLLAGVAGLAGFACARDDDDAAPAEAPFGSLGEPDQELGTLVKAAADALDVFDLRVTAQATLPAAHYGYIATGVDGDATLRANRAGFDRLQLRSHRLAGIERIAMGTTILGSAMESPIIVMPTGSQRAFHPDGELATARAARAQKHQMILSTVSTTSVEDVAAAYGGAPWYQLYATSNWDVTQKLVRRAEAAGCPVVALTVDLPISSNRLSLQRWIRRDRRDCAKCHAGADAYGNRNTTFTRKPMFDGLDFKPEEFDTPAMTWEFVERLKAATRMKVVVKGIVTAEDADRCVRHGADGIVVSNHGGRADESGRGTIESLPEVVGAVRRRIPVILDSGVRRGVDVLKAIALGADAVGIGRPYLWGLGAFGQEGVEAVLRIVREEFRTAMGLVGARSLAELRDGVVLRAP